MRSESWGGLSVARAAMIVVVAAVVVSSIMGSCAWTSPFNCFYSVWKRLRNVVAFYVNFDWTSLVMVVSCDDHYAPLNFCSSLVLNAVDYYVATIFVMDPKVINHGPYIHIISASICHYMLSIALIIFFGTSGGLFCCENLEEEMEDAIGCYWGLNLRYISIGVQAEIKEGLPNRKTRVELSHFNSWE